MHGGGGGGGGGGGKNIGTLEKGLFLGEGEAATSLGLSEGGRLMWRGAPATAAQPKSAFNVRQSGPPALCTRPAPNSNPARPRPALPSPHPAPPQAGRPPTLHSSCTVCMAEKSTPTHAYLHPNKACFNQKLCRLQHMRTPPGSLHSSQSACMACSHTKQEVVRNGAVSLLHSPLLPFPLPHPSTAPGLSLPLLSILPPWCGTPFLTPA